MNVLDKYKHLNVEELRILLNSKRHNFAVCCLNLQLNGNIGTIIRLSNAFLAREVIIFGNRHYNRSTAVGTFNYENIVYISDKDRLIDFIRKNQYTPIAIDNIDNSKDIRYYQWPQRPLLIFGHENHGIYPSILKICQDIVAIPQFGSVRSLNVATACSVCLYDWTLKNTAR